MVNHLLCSERKWDWLAKEYFEQKQKLKLLETNNLYMDNSSKPYACS